jgi:hypothetical protein
MKHAFGVLVRVVSLTLPLYIVCAFGVTISPTTHTESFPYYKLGETADHKESLYIGATHDYLPAKTPGGDVIIRSMTTQNIASNGAALGEQYEYLVLANCEERQAKIVVLWHRPRAGVPGEPAFPNLTGESLSKAITDAVNNSTLRPIPPNLPISKLVDVACKFVASPTSAPAKSKLREWNA